MVVIVDSRAAGPAAPRGPKAGFARKCTLAQRKLCDQERFPHDGTNLLTSPGEMIRLAEWALPLPSSRHDGRRSTPSPLCCVHHIVDFTEGRVGGSKVASIPVKKCYDSKRQYRGRLQRFCRSTKAGNATAIPSSPAWSARQETTAMACPPSQPAHAAASTMLGASLSAPCSCHTLMDA